MSTSLHLWNYPAKILEPFDATYIYQSWDEFISRYGDPDDNREHDDWAPEEILVYWEWKPSIQKGIQENINEVMMLIDELKNDDEYDSYVKDSVTDDKNICNYMYSRDYLILFIHKLCNAFYHKLVKIYVTSEDEPKVIEYIKGCQKGILKASGLL